MIVAKRVPKICRINGDLSASDSELHTTEGSFSHGAIAPFFTMSYAHFSYKASALFFITSQRRVFFYLFFMKKLSSRAVKNTSDEVCEKSD